MLNRDFDDGFGNMSIIGGVIAFLLGCFAWIFKAIGVL